MFVRLKSAKKISDIGEKAKNIHWMIHHGINVPETYVLTYSAQDLYLRDRNSFLKKTNESLSSQLDLSKSFAVRSSANLEDSFQHSFAGQFTSFLYVCSMDHLLQAIQEVYNVHQSPSIRTYLETTGISPESLKMSVIIQEMVKPHTSGVAFSKNPLTGLDEIIVEAVLGSSESLLKGGETPYRWINKWGKWMSQPSDSFVDGEIIQEVVDKTNHIASLFASPVDLEWVYDGSELYFVQLRPITQLDKINIYSNRISREVFPGLIKPLVWSVNIPLVNNAWIKLLTELIGPNTLQADELAKAFAYRAYFNMGVLGRIFTLLGMPKETLELLMGLEGGEHKPRFRPTGKTLRYLPRMLAFLLSAIRYDRKLMSEVDEIRLEYAELNTDDIAGMEVSLILNSIDRLYVINQKAAYHNIIVPLLMGAYNSLFRRQLSKIGVDITYFDSMHGLDELQDYNPTLHIRHMAEQFNALDETTQSTIRDCSYQELSSLLEPVNFKSQVESFINSFGHLSDSGNDFSSIPWRENPDLVMQMITAEADRLKSLSAITSQANKTDQPKRGHITLPLDKSNSKNDFITWDDLEISFSRRLSMTPVFKRSQRFQFYREVISSLYTSGYGSFRLYFLELGKRLVQGQWLVCADDIFYLTWDEVKTICKEKKEPLIEGLPISQRVADRKQDMALKSKIALPEIIYGDDLPPYESVHQYQEILRGIPSSKGYFQGPVKVVLCMQEHYNLSNGDVLIIPYSDVSWTPLFTRAGAVIAESGGILSHSSIVARELNLPCVVSVPGACQIPDNTIVSVNGYNGEIHILTDA